MKTFAKILITTILSLLTITVFATTTQHYTIRAANYAQIAQIFDVKQVNSANVNCASPRIANTFWQWIWSGQPQNLNFTSTSINGNNNLYLCVGYTVTFKTMFIKPLTFTENHGTLSLRSKIVKHNHKGFITYYVYQNGQEKYAS